MVFIFTRIRWKFLSQANNLSIFHRCLYRRNGLPSCVFLGLFLLQPPLCGDIISMPYSIASLSSSGSLSYALYSPIRHSGFSSATKHLVERVAASARAVTSCCGEAADVMYTEIGRPSALSDIVAIFFVSLPLCLVALPISFPLFF
jgi:hypothetical protein